MPLTCGNQDLETLGMGTQKRRAFDWKSSTEIEIIRVDTDVTKSKGNSEEVFNKIHEDNPLVIIGTQ
jgi:primosomal protein N' (replication factor Y)